MEINANFDSGSIEVVSIDAKNQSAQLNIAYDAPDKGKPYLQWFHFRAMKVAPGTACKFTILNAGSTTYPEGWINYNVCYSYDRQVWKRCPTTYDAKDGMSWTLASEHASVFFAYYPPYSQERLLDFITECQCSPSKRCLVDSLGLTLDGNTLDLLCLGSPPVSVGQHNNGKLKFWIIARQHPGESQASWWMEGFLRRLLDKNDAVALRLLDKVDFYVVPNMNPDGSKRGYLRVNAAGKNLNREWDRATMEESPEVFQCQAAMKTTGMDFCLDVHSEEELEYVFLSKTPLGIPDLKAEQEQLYWSYCSCLQQANPEFQTEFGYKMPEKGKSNLGICCAWAAQEYGCLAMTQEQPFKDNCLFPEKQEEWSVDRCRKLGFSVLDAMYGVLGKLASYRGRGPAVTAGNDAMSEKIVKIIRSCDDDTGEGVSITAITGELKRLGEDVPVLRSIIAEMCDDGLLYSTIDDDHFATTTAE
jgi:murein tripeptide amidase MpaA